VAFLEVKDVDIATCAAGHRPNYTGDDNLERLYTSLRGDFTTIEHTHNLVPRTPQTSVASRYSLSSSAGSPCSAEVIGSTTAFLWFGPADAKCRLPYPG
jgi:hypothetical protein